MLKIVPLALILSMVWNAAHAASGRSAGPSDTDLEALLPNGYRVEKVLPFQLDSMTAVRYLVAISDANRDEPTKPVRVLYVGRKGTWQTLGSLPVSEENGSFPPNILEKLSVQSVNGHDLIHLYTVAWGGGSGSSHYFQFFTVENDAPRLLKAIDHDRMSRLYFCLYDEKIYDARLVKHRREKKGRAFVYTCYLEATEFAFDGKQILPTSTARLREKQGNRFLDEKYWCMSLKNAIKRKEVFPSNE